MYRSENINDVIRYQFAFGATRLFIKAAEGSLEKVQYCLGQGAKIDQANEFGATPLQMASRNGHLDVVKELIKHGANVNLSSPYGQSSLSGAMQKGHTEIVEELKKHGADLSLSSADGQSLLSEAIKQGHIEEVKKLIKKHGNDVTTTHLSIAVAYARKEIKELIHAHLDSEVSQNKKTTYFLYDQQRASAVSLDNTASMQPSLIQGASQDAHNRGKQTSPLKNMSKEQNIVQLTEKVSEQDCEKSSKNLNVLRSRASLQAAGNISQKDSKREPAANADSQQKNITVMCAGFAASALLLLPVAILSGPVGLVSWGIAVATGIMILSGIALCAKKDLSKNNARNATVYYDKKSSAQLELSAPETYVSKAMAATAV